ncbi:hypothetical protein D9M68_858020 [compost metagenome]
MPLTRPLLTSCNRVLTSPAKLPTVMGAPEPSRSTSCRRGTLMPLPMPMVVTFRPWVAMKLAQLLAVPLARELPLLLVCSLGLPSLMKNTWLL